MNSTKSHLRLDVYLTNGRYIVSIFKPEQILEHIRNGKDQFVLIRDKDGLDHLVNVDQIVEIKVIDYE